jgi:GNAT superfamily N-acetyltransferase
MLNCLTPVARVVTPVSQTAAVKSAERIGASIGREAHAQHAYQPGADARFYYRRLSVTELALLNALYNSYYRTNRPLDEAHWLYARNPYGVAVLEAAFDGRGQLVGMRPSVPFKVWWRGEERMAYEFADALVHPGYQRRGIFTRLLTRTCEWAEREGHLLFSLPNERSLAAYRRIPTLRIVGDSCTLAKPLSWVRYFRHHWNRRKRPPESRAAAGGRKLHPISEGDVCLVPVDRFQCDFAEVHRELRRRGISFTMRTPEFLQWRYFGSPVRKYRVALVKESGQVRGYLVMRMVSRIAHIADLFLYPDAALARRSFRLAAKWASDIGSIGIHFSCVGNPLLHEAARQSGYWLRKRSRRFVVNDASAIPGDVYFAMGDFDFL